MSERVWRKARRRRRSSRHLSQWEVLQSVARRARLVRVVDRQLRPTLRRQSHRLVSGKQLLLKHLSPTTQLRPPNAGPPLGNRPLHYPSPWLTPSHLPPRLRNVKLSTRHNMSEPDSLASSPLLLQTKLLVQTNPRMQPNGPTQRRRIHQILPLALARSGPTDLSPPKTASPLVRPKPLLSTLRE